MATSLITVLDPLGGLEHGGAGLDVRRQAVNPSLAVSGANELGVKHDATLTDTPAGLHVVSAVGVISSLSAALSFVGDVQKDVDVAMGVPSLLLALSRMYVDVHPGGPFYDIATLTFYNNPDRRDDHIIYLAQVPIVHTTLAAPATPGPYAVTYVVYSDAGHTVVNPAYSQVDEIWQQDFATVDELWNAPYAGHEVPTTFGGLVSLIEQMLNNRLELGPGAAANWTLYKRDDVTVLRVYDVTDAGGNAIVCPASAPARRTRGV